MLTVEGLSPLLSSLLFRSKCQVVKMILLLLLLAVEQEVDKCAVIVVLDGKKEIGIIIIL